MIKNASDSLLEDLILRYNSAKSKKHKAKKAFEIAKNAHVNGSFDKAREFISIAIYLATDIRDDALKAQCMVSSGALYIIAEQYEEAKNVLINAYHLSYTHRAYRPYVLACTYLSDLYSIERNFTYSYSYLLMAEELRREKGFTDLDTVIKSRFAFYYYQIGNIRKSLSTLVSILHDRENKEYINVINSVGICLDILGYKGHAILSYLEALSEIHRVYAGKRMGTLMQYVTMCILMNIVRFYMETEDFHALSVYYEQLQSHMNMYVMPPRYVISAKILTAKKMILENKTQEATFYLTSLLHDEQYAHFPVQKGIIISTLAEIESKQNNFEASAKLMEDSIPYLYNSGEEATFIATINSYASMLLKLGQFEKAMIMAEEALSKSMEMVVHKNAIEANRLIVEIARQSNNIERELRAYRAIDELERTIKSSDDQSLYKVAVTHVAIRNERDTIQQLTGTIEQLESELVAKNSELQSMGLQIIHTNKLLADIERNIHQWQPNEVNAHFLKSTVSNYLAESSRIEWEMYEKHFSEMYPDFVRTLTKKFPLLSLMEVKVCTLIKSQFTSEKIADILCLSRRTVDSHRYRIRKKLNLEPNANLYSYFNQL